MEYFEGEYSPVRLDRCETEEEVKSELVDLAEEIFNDTGSKEITREWFIDCGAVLCNL